MKVKTSITLSRDLLEAIDEQSNSQRSRSEFIENALRIFLAQERRRRQNAADLEVLNGRAVRLNREAHDALEYQVIP